MRIFQQRRFLATTGAIPWPLRRPFRVFSREKSHASARATKESLAAVISDAAGAKGAGRALATAQVYLA